MQKQFACSMLKKKEALIKANEGGTETYTAKIKVGNFNTGSHYTKEFQFESSGKENIGNDLKAACREIVPYNAVWWLLSLTMENQKKFMDSFH